MYDKLNELCGLIIKPNEKRKLLSICLKYKIPITYIEPFQDDKTHCLWGVSNTGIALVGTQVMKDLKTKNKTIFESLDDFEIYLFYETIKML